MQITVAVQIRLPLDLKRDMSTVGKVYGVV